MISVPPQNNISENPVSSHIRPARLMKSGRSLFIRHTGVSAPVGIWKISASVYDLTAVDEQCADVGTSPGNSRLERGRVTGCGAFSADN